MTVTSPGPRSDSLDRAVDAAMVAGVAYQKQAREAVWFSPSRRQVRVMVEAAWASLAAGSDPDTLGRIAHDTYRGWLAEQKQPEGWSYALSPSWGDLTPALREAMERIGSAVAAQALADFEAEREEAARLRIRLGVAESKLADVRRELAAHPDTLAPENVLRIIGSGEGT